MLKELLCNAGCEDTVVLERPDYLSAIIGIRDDGRLVYCYEEMVDCLMREDGMEVEEAMEFIDYNAIGALPCMGEKAPIVMHSIEGYL